MAKKQKHPEHENLERWLVSYADFITLLFATFVVLYALAQVDATDFAKLEESLKNAFSQNTLFDGQQALMDGSDSIFDQQQANSFIPSLMLEYISPRRFAFDIIIPFNEMLFVFIIFIKLVKIIFAVLAL